ncbi:glycoside hydrolase family 1 protein [Streptococcus sp. H49]|uniref:glycoside hydrolase family 1 protein n=1 Tax=Streptococcus huangxiaojuni TaxID=3237239 RepID=UPI0034A1844D
MEKLVFPEHFWWGAATSGPQSEGNFKKKHQNVMDYWYAKAPEDFYNQLGPDTASDFYHDFQEDIKLMKACGLNTVRTSIQWSRLIDDLEKNTVNTEAAAFYNAVIDAFIANGIEPFITLHHFDLPAELLHKYGGWESKYVVDLFAGFAEQCFELFGDRVKHWFTHNEPLVVVEGGYLEQFHYPKKVDGKAAVQVAYNLQLASSKAIAKYRQLKQDGQIGIILNLTPAYPASQDKEDLAASQKADLWYNRLFMDASSKGEFPPTLVRLLEEEGVLWQTDENELALIRENTIDLLGVNFYHPNRVQRPKYSPNSLAVDFLPDKYWQRYDLPMARMNIDKGWEIYPQAVYDIAKDIQENYGNLPWYISENGMGVSREERYLNAEGIVEDDYRIQFIKEHLYWLHKGISEGSNCLGYHLWTPIDCWSWSNAYRNRYGLIANDIHTQTKKLKKSARWLRKTAESGQFEIESAIIKG